MKELFEKDLILRQKKHEFDNEKVLPKDPKSEDIKDLIIEMDDHITVSYTHLTLPTNREV